MDKLNVAVACLVSGYNMREINGNTIVWRHIREENRLVTNNPLGHRPIENIGWNDGRNVEVIIYKTESKAKLLQGTQRSLEEQEECE